MESKEMTAQPCIEGGVKVKSNKCDHEFGVTPDGGRACKLCGVLECTLNDQSVIIHICGKKDHQHKWDGPVVNRKHDGGGYDSTGSCSICGMLEIDWAMWNLP
jgi:hypothetical protein